MSYICILPLYILCGQCSYFFYLTGYADVKHFVVDVSSGQYQFVGPQQKHFSRLEDLMTFYRYTHPSSTSCRSIYTIMWILYKLLCVLIVPPDC